MPIDKNELLRKLPSVDAILQDPVVRQRTAGKPGQVLADCARAAVEETRRWLMNSQANVMTEEDLRRRIVEATLDRVKAVTGRHYRRAINATGIILHTGLGRAVLAAEAIGQIAEELAGYSVLQIDLETGERSKRDERIEWLLQRLTGCEAATVVNNNAAGTALVLNTVAAGREVIVSRGQLVEIGGSFRLPEVMAASGAKLVEVGTTNKTHTRDYEKAITENTAAILRVHPSNYKIVGFTADVEIEELEKIAHGRGLALIDDVGSGALLDFSRFGFEEEPTLARSIRAGADLITCSADKLIGGSQGGIVLGKATWVTAVRKNPFARIVRVGKLTLAALEATLSLFLDEATAMARVPTLRMLVRPVDEIAAAAGRMMEQIKAALPDAKVTVADGFSQMGSGSLPAQNLPTKLLAIDPGPQEAGELARRLRNYDPPIVARVHKGQVLVDPRTLLAGQEELVTRALTELLTASP